MLVKRRIMRWDGNTEGKELLANLGIEGGIR